MKILLFGSSGSGKSTLVRQLAKEHGLPYLELDSIVREPGELAVRRPPEAIAASLSEVFRRTIAGPSRAAMASWWKPHRSTARR